MQFKDTFINIDTRIIDDHLSNIKNQTLKYELKKYQTAIKNINLGLSFPYMLVAAQTEKKLNYQFAFKEFKLFFQKIVNEEIEPLQAKNNLDQMMSAIEAYMKDKDLKNEVEKHLDELIQNKKISLTYKLLLENYLLNFWTYYENTSKDLWVRLLNTYPQYFAKNIIYTNRNISEKNSGINEQPLKTISLIELEGYSFNITNHLGDVLKEKYKFTSTENIVKAYSHMFVFPKKSFIFNCSSDLLALEATRNLLVHNAGIIDNKFINKTGNDKKQLGKRLEISKERYMQLVISSTGAILELFTLADIYLKKMTNEIKTKTKKKL